MRVTPQGMALVAARVGKASAEALVRMTPWEQKAADLETQRATLAMIQAEINMTDPVYRGPLKEQLASTKARIRSLSASLKRRSERLSQTVTEPSPPAPPPEHDD